MRKVSVRTFQQYAGLEIKKGLPIELTNHGKTVAYVTESSPAKEQEIIHETIHNVERPLAALTEMVNALKYQNYPQRKTPKLIMCDIHHVYTKTCGCDRKGGEK
jgi:antitoxin (DNA-binding transcriptional repressor) of toxin-antitoxin stability system